MFTQCPECNTAFRVTAEVLKKATGQVRCGGCSIAFNALEHLSEERPESAPWTQPNEQVPELTPETDDRDKSLPKTISAEQSAALLKTLDELAGSDIKIEDTGVEWRVLGSDSDDDEPDLDEQKAAESQLIADTGALKFVIESDDDGPATDASEIFEAPGTTFIDSNLESDSGDSIIDEFLTESPTPVDEFLTQTPSRVESPEVFADVDATPDVMRFDDNTPLPDDFDLGDSAPYVPEPPPVEPIASVPDDADPQADLALGDPDEWELLLGEVDESTTEESSEKEVDEALSTLDEDSIDKEIRLIADEAASNSADDTPPDMDTQFAIQAEAMGIDLSGMHQSITDNDATGIDEPDAEPQDDGSDDEPDKIPNDDSQDISDKESEEEPDEDPGEDSDDEQDESEGEQSDIAAAAEVDDSGNDSEFYRTLVKDIEALNEAPDEGLLKFEDEDSDLKEDPESGELELDDDLLDDNLEDAISDEADDFSDELPEEGLEAELDGQSDDLSDEGSDAKTDEETHDDELETSLDEDLIAAAFASEAAQQSADANEEEEINGEHYVPPQTEEEKTINMMIDQDFMRLAAEGEDIFTSTVVEDRSDSDEVQNVETIVMEGEFVQSALNRENLAASAATGSWHFDDTKFSSKPASDKTPGLRGGRIAGDPAGIGIIAGTVVLALILVIQVLHQSREALATVPTFSQAIGPIYRAIGSPLTPSWDVAGWRFEVTKGSADENNELLTIYSRLGNTSDGPLPYPLVHVSLTDRFEEIIGSKVLEPREYLAGNPDPSKAVESGSTFNAVISIESPAAEATGFRLNVCYRLANRQLRCAIEDFK